MTGIRTVGVVGAGAIGASWTALALSRGVSVVVHDPDPEAAARLRPHVDERLADLGAGAGTAAVDLVPDLATLAARAELVLEAGPERIEVKQAIFAALDDAAPANVLLTSGSSGLTPSEIQRDCRRHPERVLVAHPFNPPHLVPLVELVGGRQTSETAMRQAQELFTWLGKRPIRVNAELPGHVANRLQAALWREAYHLVDQGYVTVADIDTAIAHGPGPRWALLGPFATQHLSGGPGGLAHVLEHLGPPMVDWWNDLGSPTLTPELCDRLVAGVQEEFSGTSEEAVRARRDRALIALLAMKQQQGLD